MTDVATEDLADRGTLVLLGAGASVGAGFPTSRELHELLCKRLDPAYQNLARLVFKDEQAPDPERLFRVMEFLAGVEDTTFRRFDTALGNEAGDIASLVKTWCPDIDEYLKSQRYGVQGSPLQRVIEQLWKALVDIFTMSDLPEDPRLDYLADLASAMRGQTIVTLNYDDALEHMPGRAMTFQVHSGPEAEPVTGERVDPRTAPLRLIKLHGSLDWSRDVKTGYVVRQPPEDGFRNDEKAWIGHTPGVIFGAGNKLRPDGPYLGLYQEFLSSLSRAQQVIVIGYSFRDAHINEALHRWFLEQAQDNDLLRIGDLAEDMPAVVERWSQERKLDIQYVQGPAQENMGELIKRRPRLMRP